jgi:general secretion pathway protein F
MRFQIKGYHPAEGVVSLSLDAASLEEAHGLAGARGLNVISIQRDWMERLQRESSRHFDLLLFSQELHALLSAGLSIIETLGTIARKEPVSYKRTLVENLIRQLREGKPFSAALNAYPEEFPPLYLALTAASERTGDLGNALSRFIAYRIQMDTVRKKIVSSAIYPILLLGVGGLVILFLMGYVVPRFARIYEDFGRELPFMSKLLLQWGTLVGTHGLQLLAGFLGLGVLFAVFMKQHHGWQGLLRRLLANETLRQRFRLYEISRFYRTLGMLQQGGIPIVPASDMAGELLGSDLQRTLATGMEDIRAGTPFSAAMERQGLAPTVALDLLKVGEKTGDLGEKMIRIADFYDEDLSRWVEWFTRLFEPILMLLIGLFIAFIVVLLYLPIFDLAGNLQ